jgi:hypothetical protein
LHVLRCCLFRISLERYDSWGGALTVRKKTVLLRPLCNKGRRRSHIACHGAGGKVMTNQVFCVKVCGSRYQACDGSNWNCAAMSKWHEGPISDFF